MARCARRLFAVTAVFTCLYVCTYLYWTSRGQYRVRSYRDLLDDYQVGKVTVKVTNPNPITDMPEPRPDVTDGHWGSLQCRESDFRLFAYSAFYDDREFKEESGPALVRVTAVSENRQAKNVTILCLLRYPGHPTAEIAVAQENKLGYQLKRNRKAFYEFIYTCPVRRPAVPILVSLVCTSDAAAKPQFQMAIDPVDRPKEKKDLAACVSASYSNRDPHQLVEWMELQQMFGVSKVTVYNHSISDGASKILLHYSKEGLVDLKQTRSFGNETGSPYEQAKLHKVVTANDCLYRNMFSFKKILVMDFDELVVPRSHTNLSEMLAAIDRDFPTQHPARSYIFRNSYFPFELSPDATVSTFLTTLRYRKRLPASRIGHQSKPMVDTKACSSMNLHRCVSYLKRYDQLEGSNITVQVRTGMSHHYNSYCRSDWDKEECLQLVTVHVKDDTMLRFKDQLIPRVQQQLQKLGLQQV